MTLGPYLSPNVSKPVSSLPELQETIAGLQRVYPGFQFLYRGQTELHERVRSSKSRGPQAVNPEVQAGWRALACGMLGLPYAEGSTRFAEAILQHYGAPTHYVDLTHDPRVAAWFALHRAKQDTQLYAGTCFREVTYICYDRIDSEHGYVLVFAFPDAASLAKLDLLFPLEGLPANFVRPVRQKGWLMLDQPPIVPSPNQFWISSIPIICRSFTTDLTCDYLFPGPDQDPAFKALATLPYVQVPVSYFRSEPQKTCSREEDSYEKFCFASRALALPEYLRSPTGEAINHKWEDFVIFEPDPMRMWKNWRSELSDTYPELTGNIGLSTKITIAPSAFSLLTAEANALCSWPSAGSNDILFTFAALDHDKVTEHGPTYNGVWLHREGDLILEIPIVSDENVMSTTPGHGYLLREGRLSRVPVAKSCTCDQPQSHDRRVFSVLQISRLVKDGKLLFLPHPRLSKLGWFVVLSPRESLFMKGSVDSFHRIIQAVHAGLAKPSSELHADEEAYLETIRRDSKKAFEEAKSVSSDDDRWHLASGELRQAVAHEILGDELESAIVGRQLVIYIPEYHLASTELPSQAILYLWQTAFGPIATFSFY